MSQANPEAPAGAEVLKPCSLDSKSGLIWNADVRDKLRASNSDLEKAELLRRLAADADLRAQAFESHGLHDQATAARYVS